MKISITGATGFIGRRLVQKHLEMNDEIKILTRRKPEETGFGKNVQTYKADLLDGPDALSAFACGADILYHCAAGLKDVSLTYQANVEGTANLIRAASGRIGHWVQLSSVGVYGMHASGVVTESTPADPQNYYERSKLESDRLVRDASAADGFTFSILRPSIVFGRGMKNRSLFQLTEMVDRGLFFFAGPPGASANYIPVENVVNALILCACKKESRGKVYNVSDWCTMEQFIGAIAEGLGKKAPRMRMPMLLMKSLGRIGDIMPFQVITTGRVNALSNRTIYESSLITSELGYSPVVNLSDALRDFVSYYKTSWEQN